LFTWSKCNYIPNQMSFCYKDLTTLAPRKPDWDLKRDVAQKLSKLERRTRRAIAELIRDRLHEGQSNLADAVAMAQPDQVEED
jgi:coiled-coil domain-containing protein 12